MEVLFWLAPSNWLLLTGGRDYTDTLLSESTWQVFATAIYSSQIVGLWVSLWSAYTTDDRQELTISPMIFGGIVGTSSLLITQATWPSRPKCP